jgi:hypothetical protein
MRSVGWFGMICCFCRDHIPDDSLYCPKCGQRLRAPPPPTERPWGWILILSLIALIWSIVARDELAVQMLELRAQVNKVLRALRSL